MCNQINNVAFPDLKINICFLPVLTVVSWHDLYFRSNYFQSEGIYLKYSKTPDLAHPERVKVITMLLS